MTRSWLNKRHMFARVWIIEFEGEKKIDIESKMKTNDKLVIKN